MSINTLPDLNPTIVFKFENSCNNCCKFCCIPLPGIPNDKTRIYVNHNGNLEKFDTKKAQGNEDEQTWQRITNAISQYFETFKITDTDQFFQTLETYFKKSPMDYETIQAINSYVMRFLHNQFILHNKKSMN